MQSFGSLRNLVGPNDYETVLIGKWEPNKSLDAQALGDQFGIQSWSKHLMRSAARNKGTNLPPASYLGSLQPKYSTHAVVATTNFITFLCVSNLAC